MKNLIITIVFLGFAEVMFGQTNVKAEKVNTDKITLAPAKIEQDSAVATWPVLVSVAEEEQKNFREPAAKESHGDYSVNFYTHPEKGIIYVRFENLSKSVRPQLYFSNEKGDVIHKITAVTQVNVINLNKVPPGNYLITADVEEEISTWEVIKE
jgi:hypothetical protein